MGCHHHRRRARGGAGRRAADEAGQARAHPGGGPRLWRDVRGISHVRGHLPCRAGEGAERPVSAEPERAVHVLAGCAQRDEPRARALRLSGGAGAAVVRVHVPAIAGRHLAALAGHVPAHGPQRLPPQDDVRQRRGLAAVVRRPADVLLPGRGGAGGGGQQGGPDAFRHVVP
ncbi:MAG: hypothetical protein ABIZ91_17445 [Gemmatimonadaceae bacterium]